jgi:hypothetical protein
MSYDRWSGSASGDISRTDHSAAGGMPPQIVLDDVLTIG